jgi:hypothetical protein
MKLQAGCFYLTRDGQIVGPLTEQLNRQPWIFCAKVNGRDAEWLPDGNFYNDGLNHPLDLVSEAPPRLIPALTANNAIGLSAAYQRALSEIKRNQEILGTPKITVVSTRAAVCTCPLHGPTGLLARGCQCGGQ